MQQIKPIPFFVFSSLFVSLILFSSCSSSSSIAATAMADTSAPDSSSASPEAAVHIIYTKRPENEEPEAHHLRTLASVLGSEEKAKEALLYSYKHVASGFSAKLTPDQVSRIQGLLKNAEQPLLDNLGETKKNANTHIAATDDDHDKLSAEDCDGFPSKPSLDEDCDLKVGFLKNAEQPILDNLGETREFGENETGDATNAVSDDDDGSSVQYCDDSGDE